MAGRSSVAQLIAIPYGIERLPAVPAALRSGLDQQHGDCRIHGQGAAQRW
jgi:hypothetical protein